MDWEKVGDLIGVEADKAYRIDLLDKYRIPDKWLKVINKSPFLHNEEVNLDLSKKINDVFFIVTNNRRVFVRNVNGKLKFLYNRVDLARDWERNDKKLDKFKRYPTDVYLHLAISFFLYNENVYYDPKIPYQFWGEQQRTSQLWWLEQSIRALEEYIIRNKDTKEEKMRVMIFEGALFFPIEGDGFSFFINSFLNLNMRTAGKMACEEMARFMYSEEQKRKLFLEYALLLCDQYVEARQDLFAGRYEKVNFSAVSGIEIKPDGTKKSLGVSKNFRPKSLGFFGDRIPEFLTKKDEITMLRIWLERVEDVRRIICEKYKPKQEVQQSLTSIEKVDVYDKEASGKLEIDFSSNKQVKINGRFISLKSKKGIRQEFRLLEEVLSRKGDIHWTAGFILFKEWQKNVPKEGPVEQFRHVITELNKLLGIRLLIPSEKKNVRAWALSRDFQIESSIEKSELLCEKLDNLGDISARSKQLKDAFMLYPDSIIASKLLVNLLDKYIDSPDFDEELKRRIIDVHALFRLREEQLKAAIAIIQSKGAQGGWQGDWKEAKEYLWLMIKEVKDIEEYRVKAEGCLKGVAIDSENARCLALTEMITIMKGSDESIFRKFIEEQEIHECVKIVSTKFMQKVKDQGFADVNLSEINNRAIMCLWEEIKRWSFPKVKKTTELKNYLIQTIFYRLFEWFLEDKYEIPRNKQNDLWRLQRARRELKRKSGANPTVEELIKKLGPKWDRKRIQEIITYEGRLGGFVDLKSEDEYLDKLTLNEDEHLDSSPDSVS